jgi:hypothetical protein
VWGRTRRGEHSRKSKELIASSRPESPGPVGVDEVLQHLRSEKTEEWMLSMKGRISLLQFEIGGFLLTESTWIWVVERHLGAKYSGQWLTPVIPAAWEDEFGRILVPGQKNPKKFARPHLKGKRLSMVTGTCHPSYSRKYKIGS